MKQKKYIMTLIIIFSVFYVYSAENYNADQNNINTTNEVSFKELSNYNNDEINENHSVDKTIKGMRAMGFTGMGLILTGSTLFTAGVVFSTLYIFDVSVHAASSIFVELITFGMADVAHYSGNALWAFLGVTGILSGLGIFFLIGLPLCIIGFSIAKGLKKKYSIAHEVDYENKRITTGFSITI